MYGSNANTTYTTLAAPLAALLLLLHASNPDIQYAAFYFCLTKLTKYPFLRKKATIVSARCSYTLTYFLIYLILHYTVTMKFTIIIYILIFIIYIKNKYIKIY